jgi:hypothetical protein
VPNCKSCGRPLVGLRGKFFIVCKECDPTWPRIQEERKVAEAKTRLMSIIEQHIKGEKLRVFGLAYWDTAGTAASSIFDKAVGAALLGGLGYQMTGKTHRLGVIAVTETKLYVIELGDFVGEEVQADTILNRISQGKEISFDLKDVKIQDKLSAVSGTLNIFKPIHLKATFPLSYDPGNRQKAAQIADVIEPTELTVPQENVGDQADSPEPSDSEPAIEALLTRYSEGDPMFLFGQFDQYQAFSDGRFVELADQLPSGLESLRQRPKSKLLKREQVDKIIPINYRSGKIVTTITERADGKVALSDTHNTVLVDRIYFQYLKCRYPNASIIYSDRYAPIFFLDHDELRAILMPMKG